MASFYTRPDGQVQVKIRKGRYKYNPIIRTFSKKTVAKRWADRIEASIADGSYVDEADARGLSLPMMIDKFIAEVLPTRSENTQTAQGRRLLILKDELKYHTLQSCDKDVLKEMYIDMLQRPVERRPTDTWSKTYVDKFCKDMIAVYKAAENLWDYPLPKGNVAESARAYMMASRKLLGANRGRGRDARFGTDDYHLVRHYKVKRPHTLEPFYKYALLFAMETGMRVGELKNMQIADILWTQKVYYLSSQKNDYDREMQQTGRLVPLNKRARAILRLVLYFNPRKHQPENEGRVWPWTGTHCGTTIYQGSMKILSKLGIRAGKTFHSTRHEFGSHLIDSGIDGMKTSAALGHRDERSRMIYVHADETRLAEQLDTTIRKNKK